MRAILKASEICALQPERVAPACALGASTSA
jgi:hypothetical protein